MKIVASFQAFRSHYCDEMWVLEDAQINNPTMVGDRDIRDTTRNEALRNQERAVRAFMFKAKIGLA